MTYFDHVNRMGNDRFPKLLYYTATHMDSGREEDQKRNGYRQYKCKKTAVYTNVNGDM